MATTSLVSPIDRPYDPFIRGPWPVGVRTTEFGDPGQRRRFPLEVWYPASDEHAGADLSKDLQDTFLPPSSAVPWRQAAVRDVRARTGALPLVVYAHPSASHRRAFHSLCTHLASHGYVVAAMDHSEIVARDLAPSEGETPAQRAVRVERIIARRVPDLRCLLDQWRDDMVSANGTSVDSRQVGFVGHSFGGWAALATADLDDRIAAVVALAPGGASNPKPGVLPLTLEFTSTRVVPTLFLIAEDDVTLPLAGMIEIFARTPWPKMMLSLDRADHYHFMDHVTEVHDAVRELAAIEEFAWMRAMRPMTDLCPETVAHTFACGLTTSHFDASLRGDLRAAQWLGEGLPERLADLNLSARLVGRA
jgi:predicted dienelactone hydrolase